MINKKNKKYHFLYSVIADNVKATSVMERKLLKKQEKKKEEKERNINESKEDNEKRRASAVKVHFVPLNAKFWMLFIMYFN